MALRRVVSGRGEYRRKQGRGVAGTNAKLSVRQGKGSAAPLDAPKDPYNALRGNALQVQRASDGETLQSITDAWPPEQSCVLVFGRSMG